ncbi:hypothetical protein LZ32DRAFT_442866 [Colletotrichum eremochloae]|nr:hypothetical protein LZ32DRAFT_442866 [Colletotrichum eremochloae]
MLLRPLLHLTISTTLAFNFPSVCPATCRHLWVSCRGQINKLSFLFIQRRRRAVLEAVSSGTCHGNKSLGDCSKQDVCLQRLWMVK